jgi:hypothetical protein
VRLAFFRSLGAALRASYRGGTWFESTAAHHNIRRPVTVMTAPSSEGSPLSGNPIAERFLANLGPPTQGWRGSGDQRLVPTRCKDQKHKERTAFHGPPQHPEGEERGALRLTAESYIHCCHSLVEGRAGYDRSLPRVHWTREVSKSRRAAARRVVPSRDANGTPHLSDGASSTAVWLVDVGVGRLNQLLGTLSTTDRNWCCDRCRAAAHSGEHAPGDKRASHDHARQRKDEIPRTGPDVIERRG